MKKTIAVLLTVVFVLCGCGSASDNSVVTKDNLVPASGETDQSNLVGTYVGLHGSTITLFSDGTAEYYWKEWPNVETEDTWKIDNNEVVMTSRSLGYDIRADISGGDTSSLNFTGEDGWEDELFVKVDDEASHRNTEYYVDLIEKQLNITIENPQKTTVGVNEKTVHMEDGIVFTLPDRYSKDSRINGKYLSGGSAILFDSSDMELAMINNCISDTNNIYSKAIIESLGKMSSEIAPKEFETCEQISVSGMDSAIYSGDSGEYFVEVAMIGDKENERLVAVILVCDKEEIYKREFREMLGSAVSSSGNTTRESAVDDTEGATVDKAGIDPDLKAFLDSYEAFVDEYVEFMQKYYANPTDLGLLANYTEIMSKYSDFAEKLEKYDTNAMSSEEYLYYFEVTTRCTQKMLEVLGN